MRPTSIYRAKVLTIVLAVAFLIIAITGNSGFTQRTAVQAPAQMYARDFAGDPPDVESISVKLLDKQTSDGNALLKVRYAREEQARLGRQVTIQLERRSVILRDDGQGGDEKAADGIFSGVVGSELWMCSTVTCGMLRRCASS